MNPAEHLKMQENNWLSPDNFQPIQKNEVHIWRFSLEPGDEVFAISEKSLTTAELKQADKFLSEKRRKQYIAARGQLKILLGRYLRTSPKSLEFSLNQYGKPYLPNSLPALYFNISHSHKLALAGFSSDLEIGVDVEYKRPDWSGLHIAERFFAEEEVRELNNLPMQYQHQAFFECWSRKEAYIKARGTGLATPLRKFTVSINPERPAKLLSTIHEPKAVDQWSLKNILVHHDYSAAAVANAKNWQILLYDGIDKSAMID